MDKKRVKKVIAYTIGIIIFSIVYYVINKLTGLGIPCPSYTLFHFHCPGCGLTRMIFSMMELNFYQAFRYNPFLFIMFPFFLTIGIDSLLAYLYNRETMIYKKIPLFVWIIIIAVAIIFGVIRNIGPFTYLAPTEIEQKK